MTTATATVDWGTVTNKLELPADYQEALERFVHEEMSLGRLSKILGVSLWDIYPVLHRLNVHQASPTMEELDEDAYGPSGRR